MSSINCSVRGCYNNWKKKTLSLSGQCFEHGKKRSECCGPAFHLFPPPSNDKDLQCWLKALNLKNPPKRPYVCSFHFVEKKPTSQHPYPEKWLGYSDPLKKPRRRLVRQTDALRRDIGNTSTQEEQKPGPASPLLGQPLHCHKAVQFSSPPELHRQLLRTDQLSLLYTGLLPDTFYFVADHLTKGHINTFQLDAVDQILMTIIKLRLNLLQADLAERFQVSQPEVSRITSLWLDIMEEKLKHFIPWLPRETLLTTMPQCFKEHYAAITCVIHRSQTPLQKPHKPDPAAELCRHHFGQMTLKYVVALAPCGLIMFVSAAYGGSSSDRFIMSDCGVLNHLQPGDVVMANSGFLPPDLLEQRRVKLVTPEFTKREIGLSEEDATHIGHVANVQVQVERVIRRLQNFRILSQTAPINLLNKFDHILRICAALSNLCGEIIHEDEL